MRIQLALLLLIALAFAVPTSALRSERYARRLQAEGQVPPDDKGPKGEKSETGVAGTNEEKEKSKKSKKEKSKKEKKCKHAKSSKKSGKSSAAEAADDDSDDEDVEEAEAMDYCLHGRLSPEECAALEDGQLPKDDPNVRGKISMEIAHDGEMKPEEIERSLGDILRRDTPPKFTGCKKRRRLADDGDEMGAEDMEEESLSVTGVDFDKLNLKRGCSDSDTTEDDTTCNKLSADARVYYTGKDKASPEEKEAMFDLLVEIIQTQAARGDFASVGEVRSVGSPESSDGGGSSGAGMPVGIAIGAVVVVGLVAGLFYYKRRTATASDSTAKAQGDTDSSDESGDEGLVHAHAVVMDDDEKKAKKKGEVEEVQATAVAVNHP